MRDKLTQDHMKFLEYITKKTTKKKSKQNKIKELDVKKKHVE